MLDNLAQLVANRLITTTQGWPDHASVDKIVEDFFEFTNPYLSDSKGKPTAAVYIEHILFSKKGKSTARAEAAGVIKWNLRQEGVPVYLVVPKAVNSFIGARFGVDYPSGRGDGLNADQRRKRIKQLTRQTLHTECNFYANSEDEADAYAIALFGYGHCVEKQSLSAQPAFRLI